MPELVRGMDARTKWYAFKIRLVKFGWLYTDHSFPNLVDFLLKYLLCTEASLACNNWIGSRITFTSSNLSKCTHLCQDNNFYKYCQPFNTLTYLWLSLCAHKKAMIYVWFRKTLWPTLKTVSGHYHTILRNGQIHPILSPHSKMASNSIFLKSQWHCVCFATFKQCF